MRLLRQGDDHGQPAAGRANGPDAALVGGSDALRDGQAQPVSAGGGIVGGVGAVKPVEQMGQMLLFHRLLGGIFHRQAYKTASLFQPHRNIPAGWRIFDGVIKQH